MTRTITQHSRPVFPPIPNFLEWAIKREMKIAEQSAQQNGERK